jgi:hypothetical protein
MGILSVSLQNTNTSTEAEMDKLRQSYQTSEQTWADHKSQLLEELKLSKEQHVLLLASEKQALRDSFTVDMESLHHSVTTQRDQWHEEKHALMSQSDELRVCGRSLCNFYEYFSFQSMFSDWYFVCLFVCLLLFYFDALCFSLVQQKLTTLDADLISTLTLLKTTEVELASTRSILLTTQSEAASVRTMLAASEDLVRQSAFEHSTILSQLKLARYSSIHL